MSWMAKLYETYEAGLLLTDLPDDKRLMPTSHTLQNAHINIAIDGEGNFKRASVLEKTQIVLPATERSASRSSGEAPHPLADKLQYVAQDYAAYGGLKKPYFDGYKKLLSSWCLSEFSHPKATAVLRYIEKGTVIKDLIDQKVVFIGDDGLLLTSWVNATDDSNPTPTLFKVLPKEKGLLDQGSALVCWTVEIDSNPNADTWKDRTLQDSWIAFDNSEDSEAGLCFVTGKVQSLSINHPAKIRHSGDKAKLISSNDTSGYTYRGRFLDNKEACGVGFDVSQKAHNALRWLVSRQGYRNGDQAFVSWAVSGKDIPEPLQDAFHLFSNFNFDDLDDSEPHRLNEDTVIDRSRDIGESFAHQLNKYMAGYRAKLDPNEQIVIIGLDAATPGRMGIIYYRELLGSEFLQRLEHWHKSFAWPQRHTIDVPSLSGKKPTKKVVWPVSSPAPKDIASAAYGQRLSDELKKSVVERLMPCIIDGNPFPIDLMDSCVRMATNRNGYKSDEQWLWEKNLGIACAVYRGYFQRHPIKTQRRDYTMALDENNHSRDYLYGRLLAVADRIEEVALSVGGESRSTTAARLMQRFADRPFSTWRNIELALQPYMQRLQNSRAGFLVNQKKELDAINANFKTEDFVSEKKLSGEFLLGFHCQRQKLREKTESTNETINEVSSAGSEE
ncbi:type I-C CRISPR-associated protein Cas8c/Csd1 [Moraxellaceae bacterium AER2_44_116]|nr:type I-C CRISPR-associated protein Cas8c/Csd1 [Moraxellaceae bacterium AER2_44_116]